MTIDEIRDLIRVVQETGISELEVRQGDSTVRIVRAGRPQQEMVVPAVMSVPITAAPAAVALNTASPPPQQAETPAVTAPPAPKEESQDVIVKSPIVGTYYDAPAPGEPPFVKIGDRVEIRQVLCIIESMKLMNEIEAEIAGTLVAKHVENGRAVEYGESLFTLRPA